MARDYDLAKTITTEKGEPVLIYLQKPANQEDLNEHKEDLVSVGVIMDEVYQRSVEACKKTLYFMQNVVLSDSDSEEGRKLKREHRERCKGYLQEYFGPNMRMEDINKVIQKTHDGIASAQIIKIADDLRSRNSGKEADGIVTSKTSRKHNGKFTYDGKEYTNHIIYKPGEKYKYKENDMEACFVETMISGSVHIRKRVIFEVTQNEDGRKEYSNTDYVTLTYIHECTHKYAGTHDCGGKGYFVMDKAPNNDITLKYNADSYAFFIMAVSKMANPLSDMPCLEARDRIVKKSKCNVM